MIFNTFPVELQSLIMSYFTPHELCSTIAPICKQWFRLAYDVYIWKVLNFDGRVQKPNDVAKLLGQFRLRSYRINLRDYYFSNEIISRYPICDSVAELEFYLCLFGKGCTLHKLANTFPNVRTLILDGIFSTDIDSRGHWKNLKCIKVKGVDHGANKLLAEFLLQKHEHLEEFHCLDPGKFNDFIIKLFVEGQGLNLKQLCLDFRNITPVGYQRLTLCRKITHLTICNPTHITDCELLLIVKELKNLSALRVKGSDNLFSEKFRDLFSSIEIPGLVELQIILCIKFDDEALKLILECCPNLKDLLLSRVDNVSETGLKCLVQIGSNLESLQLRYISVTKEFLTKLSQNLPNIRELITVGCPVASDKVKQYHVFNQNYRLLKKKPFFY